ncbi:arsenate reductase-like glutaredoxin family protein [Clostridium beijerinckii]|nr:arsenate reductase-like glutaredoxin family protein [Clostridium beijerinckii]
MNLSQKLKELSEEEQVKLLSTNGMLVKRPIVVGDDFVLVGFRDESLWEESLLKG